MSFRLGRQIESGDAMSAGSDTSAKPGSRPTVSPPYETGEDVQFGDFLRHARESRGLTIQQVSSETKIPPRLLNALEHGRLFDVPGGTYRRGEIIAYANAVGLDRGLALEQLERALQTVESRAPSAPQPRAAHRRRDGVRSFLLIGGVGAAIIFAITWPSAPTVSNDHAAAPTVGSQVPAAVASAPRASRQEDAAVDVASKDPASVSATPTRRQPPVPSPELAIDASARTAPAQLPRAEVSEGLPAIPGQLVIVSDPPGARVTIDGIGWGTTPLTIRHLPEGVKRIRLTKDGYAAEDRSVRLTTKSTTVTIPLRPPQ
jgi:hypothetical protein